MENKKKLIIKKAFREHVKDIFQYISKDSQTNAEKFIDGIKPKLDEIQKNPDAYSKILGTESCSDAYRWAQYLKSFKILFLVGETFVSILAMLHAKREAAATRAIVEKNEKEGSDK